MTEQPLHLNAFDYDLPEHFIAQTPVEPRDSSRLMIVNRRTQSFEHRIFRDIDEYLQPGDVLVMNNTRVIPARLTGRKAKSGGAVEILLLRQTGPTQWHALIGGKRAQPGLEITLDNSDITATVVEMLEGAERVITFSTPIAPHLERLGEMPLPPYIQMRLTDSERYQTVYNREVGSAAAPTAGLHFTPDLLLQLRTKGVHLAYCTLHIGLDTFMPVRTAHITQHRIHSERALINAENAHVINQAKLAGGRIIAVGTTSARTLETAGILSAGGNPASPQENEAACAWRPVIAFQQDTNLFIYPGYRWRVVDALITNFHLPKSTLLMMISAFAGRELVMTAYETAKQNQYRFFSFGDAMFLI